MFNFDFQKAKASSESTDINPGAIEQGHVISSGAHMQVFTDTILGIVKSLSSVLSNSGKSKAEINAKMTEFLNLVDKNGDLDPMSKKWFLETDYTQIVFDVTSRFDRRSVEFSSFWEILRSATGGLSCAEYSDDYKNKMTEQEKAILTDLQNARSAYWKAMDAYDNYIRDHAIITINELMVKYADFLTKVDAEWYNRVMANVKNYLEPIKKRQGELAPIETRPVEV